MSEKGRKAAPLLANAMTQVLRVEQENALFAREEDGGGQHCVRAFQNSCNPLFYYFLSPFDSNLNACW